MTSAQVIVLDLDGVILKSNLLKHDAMLALFTAFPAHKEEISAFILAHGGIPRKEKISELLETILTIRATPTLVADYLARYDRNLEELLHAAPLIAGVAAFVVNNAYTCYVSSSAPESEVESQLARTGLRAHFADVFGRDTPKAMALAEIKRRHPDSQIVFFGDAVGDLQAAQAANVPFVAVIGERDNFANYAVVKLQDFTSLHLVQRCIANVITP